MGNPFDLGLEWIEHGKWVLIVFVGACERKNWSFHKKILSLAELKSGIYWHTLGFKSRLFKIKMATELNQPPMKHFETFLLSWGEDPAFQIRLGNVFEFWNIFFFTGQEQFKVVVYEVGY